MASRSINKVTLLGNLTRDPELKYTPTNTAVCTFGLATNRSWITAEGKTKEEAQYHRVVAWQKLAELAGKLLTKGRKVYVEGRITYREYLDKNGQQRNITEIVMDDFIVFNDGRRDGLSEQSSDAESHQEDAPAESSRHEEEVSASQPEKKEPADDDVNPDDIPF